MEVTGTSVVMVSYHTGPVLSHAIRSVLEQEELAQLIVVDNGNPPHALLELQDMAAKDARLSVLTGHGNVGFARGCNLGAARAGGENILLLNPDCLLTSGTLAALRSALETHPHAMLAGGLIQNPDGSEQRGGRRELLTPVTAISESLGLHRFSGRRLNRHETPTPQGVCEVPAISGACLFLRRADYMKLGGLDERYFLHVEDLDFCKRVADAGGKTLFVPGARILHLLSTSDAPSAFIERCKARGFMRYFHTHYAHLPRPVLWLADAGIMARCGLKIALARLRRQQPAHAAGKKLLMLLAARQCPPMTDLHGKTVIVTGATSLLGMPLIGHLLAAGARVEALSRKPGHALPVEGLNWRQADLGDANMSLPKADFAIHCAPLWTLPPALAALSRAGVHKVIAFGSTSLFGKENSRNPGERQVVTLLRQAEELLAARCEKLGMAWTILRPTLIYGTGMDGNVSRIARNIRRWKFFPLFPPASGLRQPVHADDLAIAALLALLPDETSGKAYNLSGGETLSYREMVLRVFRTLGIRPRLVPLPFLPLALDVSGRLLHNHLNAEMAHRMNTDLVFSHDAATRDFGYAPRHFLSGGVADL